MTKGTMSSRAKGFPYRPKPGSCAVTVDMTPTKTKSGIILPDTSVAIEGSKGKNQGVPGEVVAIGLPGREWDEGGNGHSIEAHFKVGDSVIIDRYEGTVDERMKDTVWGTIFWVEFGDVCAIRLTDAELALEAGA